MMEILTMNKKFNKFRVVKILLQEELHAIVLIRLYHVDGKEVEKQLNSSWILMRAGSLGVPTTIEWLNDVLVSGGRVGIDPRGSDVPHSPIMYAHLIVEIDKTKLYVDTSKVGMRCRITWRMRVSGHMTPFFLK